MTIVAWLYIAVGAIGFAYRLYLGIASGEFLRDGILIALFELIALVSGVFVLRGANWARWLALIWMAFHVLINLGSVQMVAGHTLFLIAIGYCLLNRRAKDYFQAQERIKIPEGPSDQASSGQ